MKDEGLKSRGYEGKRAGGLEGNTGLAGCKMKETLANARARKHEEIQVGGLEGTWAGVLEENRAGRRYL
jgi:hypothetical protein